jgi:hypothetical protein
VVAGDVRDHGPPIRDHGLETYLKMIIEEDRDKAVYDLKAALGKGGPFTRDPPDRRRRDLAQHFRGG